MVGFVDEVCLTLTSTKLNKTFPSRQINLYIFLLPLRVAGLYQAILCPNAQQYSNNRPANRKIKQQLASKNTKYVF
ncbi:MAG: hypothetical protein U0X91_24430 [Spirosomataceae bacterium]